MSIVKKWLLIATALLLFVMGGCVNEAEPNQSTNNSRFTTEIADYEYGFTTAYIITDKDTGIQYLYIFRGDSGGLTPLLDSDGNVQIKATERK